MTDALKKDKAPSGSRRNPAGGAGQSGGVRKPPRTHSTDPVQVIIERGELFENFIKTMKRLSLGLGVLGLLSVGLTFVAVNTKTEPVYFVAYEDGTLVKMVPLNRPNHSQQAVSQWLTEALVGTFDFHFGNIADELNDAASRWFTSAGADALMKTWEESGNYEAIVDRQLFISLGVTHTPLLIKHGLPPGGRHYIWRFQVPATLTFRNQSQTFSNRVTFTVDVSRRSILEDPKGLGISKIVMRIES